MKGYVVKYIKDVNEVPTKIKGKKNNVRLENTTFLIKYYRRLFEPWRFYLVALTRPLE